MSPLRASHDDGVLVEKGSSFGGIRLAEDVLDSAQTDPTGAPPTSKGDGPTLYTSRFIPSPKQIESTMVKVDR